MSFTVVHQPKAKKEAHAEPKTPSPSHAENVEPLNTPVSYSMTPQQIKSASKLLPGDEIITETQDTPGPTQFRRKILRQIEVPYVRQVKVPIRIKKVVPCVTERTIPVKKLEQVTEIVEIEEEYTEYVQEKAIREKTVTVEKTIEEDYQDRIPVVEYRKVMRPVTKIKEVEEYVLVPVTASKVVETEGWRLDTVEGRRVEESYRYDIYKLLPYRTGQIVRGASRVVSERPEMVRREGQAQMPEIAQDQPADVGTKTVQVNPLIEEVFAREAQTPTAAVPVAIGDSSPAVASAVDMPPVLQEDATCTPEIRPQLSKAAQAIEDLLGPMMTPSPADGMTMVTPSSAACFPLFSPETADALPLPDNRKRSSPPRDEPDDQLPVAKRPAVRRTAFKKKAAATARKGWFSLPRCLDYIAHVLAMNKVSEDDIEFFSTELEGKWRSLDLYVDGSVTLDDLRTAIWKTAMGGDTPVPEGAFPSGLQVLVDDIYRGCGSLREISFWAFVNFSLEDAEIQVPIDEPDETWAKGMVRKSTQWAPTPPPAAGSV